MAEPISPAGDATGDRPAAAESTPAEPELLAPPTEEELAATGEPTLEEIRAAAAGDSEADTAVVRPAATEATPPPPPPPPFIERAEAPTVVEPAAEERTPPPPPVPSQPVLAPADESAPPPPRARGNRLVATAWVVLAAGLFQVLYFAALGLVILLLAGAAAVAPQLANIAKYPFAWLPVVFFLLFFELTVLLLNRAGRFAYVVASLVVGLLVYIVSVLLISIIVGGGIGDTSTLAQAFESPEFVLTGLVAREVMLWTGFAIGSRGIRLRARNKEERARYDEELADA